MLFFSVTSISPVCLRVFGLDIYWYGIAYVVSIWIALFYAKKLVEKGDLLTETAQGAQQKDVISPEKLKQYVDSFVPLACVGIVVGGRLGHVIFFDISYYAQNLLKVWCIRDGGMSFHGGLIGLIFAAAWFTHQRKIRLISYLDLLAMVAPVGLAIGRVANFINSELYGIPTTLPWGVFFHGTLEPRHPTQIYEALTEGVLTLTVLAIFYRLNKKRHPGELSIVFLLCYGISRFLIDFVKDSSHYVGLTMGQWLSIAMVLSGVFMKTTLLKKLEETRIT
jgi:phosphatidylglycerol:prolipoprotein diacylglycerol transferase